MRSVACQRPGVGAISRRRNSANWEIHKLGAVSVAVTNVSVLWIGRRVWFWSRSGDGHHGRRADAEGVVGICHLNPHRKTLRQPHPIQITRHVWQSARTRSVFRNNGPGEADDFALEPFPAFVLQINLRRRTLLDM